MENEATCDYCGKGLDCANGSVRDNAYWSMDHGVRVCDDCLPNIWDDFPDRESMERLFWLRALHVRRINVEDIHAMIDRAREAIVPGQVDTVAIEFERAGDLFRQGERFAAMEAVQAAWNAANGLHNAVTFKPELTTARKVRRPFAEANADRQQDAENRAAEWQRLASGKWADPLHAGKSASDIARLIALPDEKPGTIRRKIKKLS